jgi:hypothetical protein
LITIEVNVNSIDSFEEFEDLLALMHPLTPVSNCRTKKVAHASLAQVKLRVRASTPFIRICDLLWNQ